MTAEKSADNNPAEVETDLVTADASQNPWRMAEALLFAAVEPLDEGSLAVRLPEGADITRILAGLRETYENRGVNLVKVAGKWAFRTAPDLAHVLQREVQTPRRLSRAAVETLAIVAYHQPVTRSEIEEIRGVSISKGTLDLLIETGWVRLAGRRRTPGRPVTYGITDAFLEHFGLEDVKDLPGIKELKAAGLLDSLPPLSYGPASSTPDEADDETDDEEINEDDDEKWLEGDNGAEDTSEPSNDGDIGASS